MSGLILSSLCLLLVCPSGLDMVCDLTSYLLLALRFCMQLVIADSQQ